MGIFQYSEWKISLKNGLSALLTQVHLGTEQEQGKEKKKGQK